MRRSASLSLLACLSLFACGDEGAPQLRTNVPANTPVDSLTPAQTRALCEDFEDFTNELFGPRDQQRIGCVAAGIIAEQNNLGTCEGIYRECMKQDPETTPIDFMCETAGDAQFTGCTATVGQVTECVNGVGAVTDSLLDSINCSLASNPDAITQILAQLDDAVDPTTLEGCEALPPTCTDLLGLGADGM